MFHSIPIHLNILTSSYTCDSAMPGSKSIEEIEEMHPDERHDYLHDIDIFSEAEWELYRESTADSYPLREITNRTFTSDDGQEYVISVENWSDGESPDEMNTKVHVIEKND